MKLNVFFLQVVGYQWLNVGLGITEIGVWVSIKIQSGC